VLDCTSIETHLEQLQHAVPVAQPGPSHAAPGFFNPEDGGHPTLQSWSPVGIEASLGLAAVAAPAWHDPVEQTLPAMQSPLNPPSVMLEHPPDTAATTGAALLDEGLFSSKQREQLQQNMLQSAATQTPSSPLAAGPAGEACCAWACCGSSSKDLEPS
jgi:hypothetical protein